MKKKIVKICKDNDCKKEFDVNESTRVYGSTPSDLGYCSAQCYTKAVVKQK